MCESCLGRILRAVRGWRDTGDLDGKAIIRTSNRAHWRSTDQDFKDCYLGFERALNRLEVHGGDEISCGAGLGVSFAGTYVASDKDPNIAPDLTFAGGVANHGAG